MTEESRGKRRKQANPRRNRGKTREGLESLKKLMRVEDVAAAFPANRAGCVFGILRTRLNSGKLIRLLRNVLLFFTLLNKTLRSKSESYMKSDLRSLGLLHPD